MSAFSAASWLENARVAVQSLWLGCFALALWASIGALHRAPRAFIKRGARMLWAAATAIPILMWLGGATLEMMRRAALVSGMQLVLALGAFSLLWAGTLSLAREWFGASFDVPLRAAKIAFSLWILTLAGWWFGGLALSQNALWFLTPIANSQKRTPDAWALLLAGATLLGASRGVRPVVGPGGHTALRVANPRLSTWALAGMALFLALPCGADNPQSASVFVLASAVFSLKIWRARADCPRLFQGPPGTRIAAMVLLFSSPLLLTGNAEWHAAWRIETAVAWQEPHQLAAWTSVLLAIIYLLGPLRPTLRRAISERFFDRALVQGALAGFGLSSVLFGPGGALFWVFWPLCGLFFDLLAPNPSEITAA